MKDNKSLEFPRYKALISIDLRCFDLRLQDYGVKNYFDTLGFLPHILLLHETNLDQVHMHDGKIDETKLDYLWCTQRGMPGGQVWTKRQLRELVEIIHEYGVLFYQGLEATWQSWPQYYSKSVWSYQHEEIFITRRDGSKTNEGEGEIGSINPLAKMKDGTWYEDILCRDIVRYLNDYNMDGYFSADGMAGLSVPLAVGDYSDGMIEQFIDFSGVKVKGNTTPEKADDIWNNHRAEWIHFYTERWTTFYKKLAGALKKAGKGIATMDAWARGPADSIYDFGFDYLKLNEVGLDYYCMESREENWGRRGHAGLYAWEPGQVVAVSTIKARAPELTLLWALCTCNAPENWHALRDVPIVLERELMSLPLTSFILPDGTYKRAYDGYLAIFGIDLNNREWRWMSERLDFSFLPDVKRILGPAIVWSDHVYNYYYEKGERWQLTAPITQLIAAGLPVRSAVNTKNLAAANSEAYILVDAEGISESEIHSLIAKRKSGADIIIIGKVDNKTLLKDLGISSIDMIHGTSWSTTTAIPKSICGTILGTCKPIELSYVSESAEVLIKGDEDRIVMSVKRYEGQGSSYYLASTRKWEPIINNQSGFTEDMPSIGEISYMKNLVNNIMPNELEHIMTIMLKYNSAITVNVDLGQYIAYETVSGDVVVQLENIGDLFYIRPKITTQFEISGVKHFPIKCPSPAGYIIDRTTHEHGCSVNVIPDGVVPIKLLKGVNELERN